MDDIDECHILLGRPWRCEVNGKYDVKRNLYIFSWEGNRIVMVPLKVTPQLPKPEAEVANEHIEKIQNLQIYKQHDDKISTLLFETTNKVGTLNACEEIIGFYDDEDVKVDVKRNFIKDKVHREKVFEVDEALDVENSRASSFQVKGSVNKNKSIQNWGNGLHLRQYNSRGGEDTRVGSSLLYHGIPKGSTGLYVNNIPKWAIVDNAFSAYSYISVLLYDALVLDVATFIVNYATVQVIFCVPNTLKDLLSYLSKIPYVRLIVVVGARDGELTSLPSQTNNVLLDAFFRRKHMRKTEKLLCQLVTEISMTTFLALFAFQVHLDEIKRETVFQGYYKDEFHFKDVNKGKHSRTSSSKKRRNDEDMNQELAEEYMDMIQDRGKSKGAAKNK
ncbi:hypothetical protein Tco_1002443 [Tanacetum coccineum]|uniref:Uncharacterized protein n=1 Tax=Tanacetum coccineum TaxID=301880 RepID=A0ABQ5F6M2_9ASTR